MAVEGSPEWVASIGPAVGERFPDLTLPDQTGQVLDLHAHRRGQPAIIIFYRSADW